MLRIASDSAACPEATASAPCRLRAAASRFSSTSVVGFISRRVDVPELLQPEQIGRVVGAVEDVRGRLIERHRPRIGRRVGHLSAMQAECSGLHLEWLHRDKFSRSIGRMNRSFSSRSITTRTRMWWRADYRIGQRFGSQTGLQREFVEPTCTDHRLDQQDSRHFLLEPRPVRCTLTAVSRGPRQPKLQSSTEMIAVDRLHRHPTLLAELALKNILPFLTSVAPTDCSFHPP